MSEFYNLSLANQINFSLDFISQYDFAYAFNAILNQEDKKLINIVYYKRFQLMLNEVETNEELYLALSAENHRFTEIFPYENMLLFVVNAYQASRFMPHDHQQVGHFLESQDSSIQ